MFQWATQRDSRFMKSRWHSNLNDGLNYCWALAKVPYFPFGGGPRICIGASFADGNHFSVSRPIGQKFRWKLDDHHS